MRLVQLIIAAICATLIGTTTSFAKPGDAPPIVDVNVVNSIEIADLQRLSVLIAGDNTRAPFTFALPPGVLHGLSLSVAARPDDLCSAIVTIESTDAAIGGRTIEAARAFGNSTAISRDYTTPISVLFDPATDTTELKIQIGDATSFCHVSLVATYEPL